MSPEKGRGASGPDGEGPKPELIALEGRSKEARQHVMKEILLAREELLSALGAMRNNRENEHQFDEASYELLAASDNVHMLLLRLGGISNEAWDNYTEGQRKDEKHR